MRNLKKILALVLALVMSLSLMATAGAADAGANGEQITPAYQTALDVLGKEGLKVFEGYSDGTFKPQQPITRAEVATILYRIATGDVNGTQSGIYTDMASTKFTDLEGANWARGYINYCANAELIVGVGNNKFQPSQNITGYATLAMVLRALGYDKAGEFRGSGWEIRTASLAKSLGITNNITDAQLGGAATREVVAEILFRAILNETVTYSALTSGGYTKTGETLAKKNLGLDDIVGVVTANEWADLYGDEPLAKDKTRLDVDGKNFNLDITSDAALLGTSVHAYVKDGRALTGLEDSGRNTIQNSEGAAAEVAKLKGGLKLTEGTEYMINFSEAGEVDYSDWRIEYVIELESDADRTLVEGNGGEWEADGKTYNKVIKVGQKITKVDMTLIQRIFYGSDNKAVDSADGVYDGEVYVGTKSTLGKDDISDEISYREFVSKYLNADSVKFDDSDNGESLRIIDNNNDGVAEYVLRVDFVMTTITDYNSRTETWTVEYDNTEIKNSEIATEEELAVGDVILYTYIDGVYHISFPETATESIAKRGIDYKKNTINCGDNTYTWSGIDRLAARYYQEITEVEVETSYTLFLDRYGYVRLATEANKGLALLTDAYYGTDWRNGDYRVETWAMGAEEATDVTVTADKGLSAWTRYADRTLDTDKAYDGFIDTYEERDHGNAGTWDRLHEFGQYRYGTLDQIGTQDDINGHYTGWSNGGNGTDPFRTNVAAYVEKDGEWTLYDVTANNSSRTNYHSYEIYDTGVDGSVSAKDRTMYGITAWNNGAKTVNTDENVRIQANTSTQYYWVQFNSRGEISKVESWTGYTNAPSDFIPERGYAITSEVADMNDRYQVAEVVVFEDAYEEDFLRAWFVNAYRDNRSLLTAGWDGETYTSDVTIDSNVLNTGKLFEFVDADGDVISANYGKYHVYAGVVMTEGRILNGDYVALSRSTTTAIPREGEHFNSGVYADKVWKEFIFGEIPVYRLNDRVVGKLNSDGRDLEECTPRMDDLVLYMTNEKGEVALVIDVTQSEETAVYNSMLALWNEVVLDYYPTLSVSVTNKDGVGPDEYNYPANHTYPINNGTVKIPASVFEAEGWTVAEKGIWVVRYGENSTYDRAGWLTEGGEEYFVIEGIKGVIGVEIEWVKVEAPEELDKDGAKAEIDGYRADEVAALTGDDAKAAADAKATAKAAIDAATTQEELAKAIADYKAAINEILDKEPVEDTPVTAIDVALSASAIRVGDEMPTLTVTATPADSVEFTAEWTDAEGNKVENPAAAAGEYTLTVKVTAKDGFVLAEDVKDTYTLTLTVSEKDKEGFTVTFKRVGPEAAPNGDVLLMPAAPVTVTDGTLVLEKGKDFSGTWNDPAAPNFFVKLQVLMGEDDAAVDCKDYLSEDGSKYEIPVTADTVITFNYYYDFTDNEGGGDTDKPPVIVVPGTGVIEDGQVMSALIPPADPTRKISYYILTAEGWTPVVGNAAELANFSGVTLTPEKDIPDSIKAKRDELDKQYEGKWTFAVWSFSFELGDGTSWPKDIDAEKDVTIAELKAAAVKAIQDAAKKALAIPGLEAPERAKIEAYRDDAIKQIMSAAVTTKEEVERIRDNAIALIEGVKAPDTFVPEINVPEIDQLHGTIDLNYYLEPGAPALTEEKLLEIINDNEDGLTFEIVDFVAEVLTATRFAEAAAIATCNGARYQVNLTHVYKVTVDGEVAGYVSTIATNVPGVADGSYLLEDEVAVETAATATATKGAGLVVPTASGNGWISTVGGKAELGDQAFVTARQITFTPAAGGGYNVIARTGGAVEPFIKGITATTSIFVQTGAMLDVTPSVDADATGSYYVVTLTIDGKTEQLMDTLTYFKDATNPGNIKGFVMNDIEAGSAIGVGVVKGALVKVDGEDLGVFDTTSAATNVPTDLEGVFVVYVDDKDTPGNNSAFADNAGVVTAVDGKFDSIPVDTDTNVVNGVLTLVPAVEVVVPEATATTGNFENVTAKLTYGVVEGAPLTMGNTSAKATFYVPVGAKIDFTVSTGTLDSIQVGYTAPGADAADAEKEIVKATENVAAISFNAEGSYALLKVEPIESGELAIDLTAAKVAEWGKTAGDIFSKVDGAAYDDQIDEVKIDSVTRNYVDDKGQNQTETGGKELLGKFVANNGLEITLTLTAAEGYYFAGDFEIAEVAGMDITTEVSADGSTLTLTVVYKVTA